MNTGNKICVSLLGALLVLGLCATAGFAGLFSSIEARFYRPARSGMIEMRLGKLAVGFDEQTGAAIEQFKALAASSGMAHSFDQIQLENDISSRIELSGRLLAETPGLRGIRLVSGDGKRIHYSTFAGDLYQSQPDLISYTGYDNLDELPYQKISAAPEDEYRLVFDSPRGILIFGCPVFDQAGVFRGGVYFYVDAADFCRPLALAAEMTGYPALAVSPNVPETAQSRAIVFGLPESGRAALSAALAARIRQPSVNDDALLEIAGTPWLIFVNSASPYAGVAGVYPESDFLFPPGIRSVLLACVSISTFLVLFLLLNLKRDDMTLIRQRVRKFQLAFFQEYFDAKEEINWQNLSNDMLRRKEELSRTIKKSLGRRGKKNGEEFDRLLENSWDDIFTVLGRKTVQASAHAPVSADELKRVFETDAEDVEELETPEDLPESIFDEIRIQKPKQPSYEPDIAEASLIELNSGSLFFGPGLYASPAVSIEPFDAGPDIIVERDGLYTIQNQNMSLAVEQDSEFKLLVDSVLE